MILTVRSGLESNHVFASTQVLCEAITDARRWVTYHQSTPRPQISDFSGTEKSDCPSGPSGTGPRRAGQQIVPFFTGCNNSDGDHGCLAMLMVLTTVP